MEYKNEGLEPGGYLECWGMAEEERVGAEEQQSERSVWTGREQVGQGLAGYYKDPGFSSASDADTGIFQNKSNITLKFKGI